MNTALILLITIVAVTGCNDPQPQPAQTELASADSLNSPAVALLGQNLADNLVAYMDRLEEVDTATAGTLRARLPLHAQMLNELLAQYEREMTILDVSGGHSWRATVDSLRTDLMVLQQTSDRELRPVLEAHQGRVGALITHHESMLATGGDLSQRHSGSAPVERRRPD